MARTHGRLVVFGVAMLAFIDVLTGLWAVIDPTGWFRDFPGTGAHWIAAAPPYNHHLVTDAGAGFLGVGVVLFLAVLWRERRVMQVALLGSLAHDLPHFMFHLLHPAVSPPVRTGRRAPAGWGSGASWPRRCSYS